jgi:O-acetyl-ADP-ribose deacetylase (regulator of RNase III)
VDGAIHRAAGPGLLDECRRAPEVRPGVRCPTGEARLTGGHDLPARYVIHTVGPVWSGGKSGEDELLASCYRNAMAMAAGKGLESIAFPAISTGVYGFPMDRAAGIAVRTVRESLKRHAEIRKVLLVCFGAEATAAFTRAMRAPQSDHPPV